MIAMVVLVAFVLFLGIRTLSRSTIYISNPSGYTAFGGSETKLTLVPKDRFDRLVKAMILGVPFDCLHVSHRNDPYAGIVLTHEVRAGKKIELMVTILRLKDPQKVIAFRDGMSKAGFTPEDDYAVNVGMGVNGEQQMLTYLCDPDFVKVESMAKVSLNLIDGETSDQLFVYPWSSADGAPSSGIRIVTPTDYLSKVP